MSAVPVVFVHGIWKDSSSFRVMSRYMQRQGFETFAITLTPNDGSAPLETLASQLAAFVTKLNTPVDLVGFSMGGLVSRYYLQRLDGTKHVRRFITIGSPHHGTRVASLSPLPASRQMRVDSQWISDLNADVDSLAAHDVLSIWTPFDLMVIPSTSARLPVGRSLLVPAPVHHMLLSDRRTLRAVSDALGSR